MYLYVSLYISIYLYISLYISIYLYISLYISIYLYIYISLYIYLYISLYISIYISMYLYVSLYISIYLYISVYKLFGWVKRVLGASSQTFLFAIEIQGHVFGALLLLAVAVAAFALHQGAQSGLVLDALLLILAVVSLLIGVHAVVVAMEGSTRSTRKCRKSYSSYASDIFVSMRYIFYID